MSPQAELELCLARGLLELDPGDPETWQRDVLRAIAAAQRALVLLRAADQWDEPDTTEEEP